MKKQDNWAEDLELWSGYTMPPPTLLERLETLVAAGFIKRECREIMEVSNTTITRLIKKLPELHDCNTPTLSLEMKKKFWEMEALLLMGYTQKEVSKRIKITEQTITVWVKKSKRLKELLPSLERGKLLFKYPQVMLLMWDGASQGEAARKSGVSAQTISKWLGKLPEVKEWIKEHRAYVKSQEDGKRLTEYTKPPTR